MAIGIYSGTFDPIHEGHVLFAQVATEQFGIDEVLLMPEPTPRYKDSVSSLDDRLAMISLATEDMDHMRPYQVIGIEKHTVEDVIADVAQQYPEDELYLLMGADVFKTIESWGQREDEKGSIADIAQSVGFIVGIESMAEVTMLREIAERAKVSMRMVEVPLPGLSSSKIRSNVRENKQPRGLNETVQTYIETIKLYS